MAAEWGGAPACGGRASGSPLLNPPSVREEARLVQTGHIGNAAGRAAACGSRASGSPLLNPPSVRAEAKLRSAKNCDAW